MSFLAIVVVPMIRSVAGWLEKSLADNKIDTFEIKQLIETVFRIGIPALALYIGFNLPGETAVAIPVVIDYVYHYIGKLIEKNNA